MKEESPVYSKISAEIVALSNEYCLFIERINQYPQEDLLPFLQKILSAMYLKGSILPVIHSEDETALEKFVTEEEYELLLNKVTSVFDSYNYFFALEYCEVEESSMTLNFAELLCDIYHDLKDFLLLFAKSNFAAKENAMAELQSCFETDWGYRISFLLPFIHQKIYGNKINKEN